MTQRGQILMSFDKERTTPLTAMARRALQAWLKERARRGATTLFPSMHGERLSADSVQALLAKHVWAAGAMPVVGQKARVATCSPAQRRHGTAPGGRRLLGDRAVAWSRVDRDDADIPSCPSCIKGGGTGEAPAVPARQTNPLPAKRPLARLPGGALTDRTMPNDVRSTTAEVLPAACFQGPLTDRFGIVRRAA